MEDSSLITAQRGMYGLGLVRAHWVLCGDIIPMSISLRPRCRHTVPIIHIPTPHNLAGVLKPAFQVGSGTFPAGICCMHGMVLLQRRTLSMALFSLREVWRECTGSEQFERTALSRSVPRYTNSHLFSRVNTQTLMSATRSFRLPESNLQLSLG